MTKRKIKERKVLAVLLCIGLLISNLAVGSSSVSAASKITLKSGAAAPASVYTGQSYSLKVSGTAAKFYSSNKKVATIGTTTGKMKLFAPGNVKIIAKSKKTGKVVATKIFKVLQRAKSVSVEKKQLTLLEGESEVIKAILAPKTSTDVIRFVSSDKTIATVGLTSGKVNARKAGNCTITVYAKATKATTNASKYNKVTTVQVEVKEDETKPTPKPTVTVPPVENDINAEKLVFKNRDTTPYKVDGSRYYYLEVLGVEPEYNPATNVTKIPVEYYSSDKSIVMVGRDTGMFAPLKSGTVRIIARHTITGEVLAARSFQIIVPKRVTSLSISPADLSLEIGATETITATKMPATSTDVIRFFSSDSSVATVDPVSGVVTAQKAGNCEIEVYAMATDESEKSDTRNYKKKVKVEVKEAATPEPEPTPTVTPQYYPAYRPSKSTPTPTPAAPTENPPLPSGEPTENPPAPSENPSAAPSENPPAPSEEPELKITQVEVVSSQAIAVYFDRSIVTEAISLDQVTIMSKDESAQSVQIDRVEKGTAPYNHVLYVYLAEVLTENKKYTITIKDLPNVGSIDKDFEVGSLQTQSLLIPNRAVRLTSLRKLLASCVRFRHNSAMSAKR